MYQALYRKWRPRTFDDVVSQPHITTTLMNQIAAGKTAHAYLFTGSRGTGKTTCARIFAKAVNCPDSHGGSPCLECEICRDADDNALEDIIELDAASNNSVDDIRDIRESAVYTPSRCRYKVYIIDEVHMLSGSAFNALLKIMEEPPEYVKFILATTEVHKVPATILSRCQRFDFRRIRTEDIRDRVLYIAGEENIPVDDTAASLIARIADGGMRDALSLLDQCVAFAGDGAVTAEVVSNAAGIADRGYLFDILEAIFRGDTATALVKTDNLYSMSKDMTRLCEELIMQSRNLMLLKTAPENRELITCMPAETERLEKIADSAALSVILSKLDILQQCLERLSRSLNRRVDFEMYLIRLCSAGQGNISDVSLAEVCERISKLESGAKNVPAEGGKAPQINLSDIYERLVRLESGAVKPAAPKPAANPPAPRPAAAEKKSETVSVKDLKIFSQWTEVVERFSEKSPAVSAALEGSLAYENGGVIFIIAKNRFFLSLFQKKENYDALSDTVTEVTGRAYRLKAKCEVPDDGGNGGDSAVEKLLERAKAENIPTELK